MLVLCLFNTSTELTFQLKIAFPMKLISRPITAFGRFAFYVTVRISGYFQLLLWCSAINQLALQCGRRRRRLQLFSHCARSKRAEMQEDGKWQRTENTHGTAKIANACMFSFPGISLPWA